MNFNFQKAVKSKAKLRLALFGPSGAGKTYTALRIATGMGGKIALIDTERGSASKYADRFSFDVLDLDQKDINTYCMAIKAAGGAGYDVLVIDSLSHAWQELLEEIDKLAKAKYRGNTWSAWSDGTPKQKQLVDVILNFPGHILATMRSKTEWTTTTDSNGKSKPERVGLAPEQGKGIEYEFDMLMELSTDHIANVIKDRTGKYQDKLINKPDEALGSELIAWLNDGAPAQKQEEPKKTQKQEEPKAEGNGNDNGNGNRPYSPQALKTRLNAIAKDRFAGKKCEQKHRSEIAAGIDQIFGNKDARHELQQGLTGKTSIKEIDDAFVLAMHLWMYPKAGKEAIYDNIDGQYLVDGMAVKEITTAHKFYLEQNGQQELI